MTEDAVRRHHSERLRYQPHIRMDKLKGRGVGESVSLLGEISAFGLIIDFNGIEVVAHPPLVIVHDTPLTAPRSTAA